VSRMNGREEAEGEVLGGRKENVSACPMDLHSDGMLFSIAIENEEERDREGGKKGEKKGQEW
jgi:hypothetical protein